MNMDTGKYLQRLNDRQSSVSEIPIRRLGKKSRLFIDNEYFSGSYASTLPKNVTLVYCVLAKYANHKKQYCFPAIPRIMEESGIKNRNSIVKAVKMLESLDIILVARSKGRVSNLYFLLDPSKWKSINSIHVDTLRRRG